MRSKYREIRTTCGSYLDIDIFPVFRDSRAGVKRGKRFKPSPDTMVRYNQRRRETRLERLVLSNFEDSGLFFNPSFDPEHYPASDEECRRVVKNFLRRLRAWRKRHGMSELKYIYKIERGKRSGRLHLHTILNCSDMPLGELDRIWGMGYCYSSALSCDADGCAGISRYFCKGKAAQDPEESDLSKDVSCSWVPSRNLTEPVEYRRDGSITKRQAQELCRLGDDAKPELEKLYEGHDFVYCKPLLNEVNGGYYITVRMRKRQVRKRDRYDRRRDQTSNGILLRSQAC